MSLPWSWLCVYASHSPKWFLCHVELSCRIVCDSAHLCRYCVCSLCPTRPIAAVPARMRPFCFASQSCWCWHVVLSMISPDSVGQHVKKYDFIAWPPKVCIVSMCMCVATYITGARTIFSNGRSNIFLCEDFVLDIKHIVLILDQ